MKDIAFGFLFTTPDFWPFFILHCYNRPVHRAAFSGDLSGPGVTKEMEN